ncbi:MAG: aldose epimerase family protein [Steroidobacterales bacterium]
MTNGITHTGFGRLPDGTAVKLYRLRNRRGMEARIATYGGIVTYLTAPDRHGRYADVVLGYDSLAGYLQSSPYFGALIGRYGNRIAHGAFSLNGVRYTLAINNPPNSLHGGRIGFDKVVWTVTAAAITAAGPALSLAYVSADGEEGYPGTLSVGATYTLTDDDTLRLEFTASTDRDTVVNLTHHSYFNLRGSGDVLSSIVQINANEFTPIDRTQIPTGELRPVGGTPLDFREPTPIGARIGADDEQIRFGRGFDHNWVIDKPTGTLGVAATVFDPESGRIVEVSSTEPGLQFYSGNFLDGTISGKGGRVYGHRHAFALEPQHYPDSPNHPGFPSTVLKPGQTFRNVIAYRFSAHP